MIKRGEVYWLEVKSDVKHVNLGRRPVLIVSNDKCNYFSPAVTVVPLTSENKKYLPTHVNFEMNGIRNCALCEQVMPVNSDGIIDKNKIGKLSESTMDKVSIALMKQLGIVEV